MLALVHGCESHGVPLAGYQLTRADHQQQEQSEDISRWVEKVLAEKEAEERADPALAERRRGAAQQTLDSLLTYKSPDHETMRWRVQLYCGHNIETSRHKENPATTRQGSSSMSCPECGKDPSIIVAYEPIGLTAEPPMPSAVIREQPPREPTRAQLERRVAALEKENRRLRATANRSQHDFPDAAP
ncbi:hypothetical protein OG936_37905 [Streptomyces sp. NBC_00846]|uniref:hypothetical protein n=1 Tax=Streptomyces sp. NBC_00846 TaxID=2975849 RepID=UPI00386439AF|nr:hypothetical protein OG936_37905 [Streptomyces sp. NBC_00846]